MQSVLFVAVLSFLLIGSAFAVTSVCDIYSAKLNISDNALVTTVVDGTIAAALGSGLHVYFDGEVPPGSTNFTSPAQNQSLANLVIHLTEFFGGALGCSDGTIAAYTGPDMGTVHKNIPITSAAFAAFCAALLGVMQGAGVLPADLATVNTTLYSTRSMICNQSDCSSAINLMVSAWLALFLLFGF